MTIRQNIRRHSAVLGSALLLALAATTTIRPAHAVPPAGKAYQLVFNDDFNGTTLDTTKWSYNYPWGNTHNGMAAVQSDHVAVANGVLKITADKVRTVWDPWGVDTPAGYQPLDYTSGAIHTNGKFRFKYGYIEGRLKMPAAVSTWPAFWMLQDGWPPELDIMEVQGSRTRYFFNYHYGPDYQNHQSFGGQKATVDLSAAFHTYGVEWTPYRLAFYFDDVLVSSYDRPNDIVQAQAMYLILNMQVGGWAPVPDTNGTEYPQVYQCDWVRVWQMRRPATGTYRITPKNATDKSLEIPGYNVNNGAPVDIYTYGGGTNGQFRLESQTDGSYKLRTGMTWSSRVLELKDWNTGDNGIVQLWDDNNNDNQRWYLEEMSTGWWRIMPKIATSKTFDVVGTPNNGAPVKTYGYWGGDNQLWRLDLLSSTTAMKTSSSSSVMAQNVLFPWLRNPVSNR